MLEGRDAILRGLDRTERWNCGNLMKFSKTKHKILHLGQGDPRHKTSLGSEWIESSPEEKEMGVLVVKMLEMTLFSNVNLQPTKPNASKSVWAAAGGEDSAPLLCSPDTPPAMLHPALGPTTSEGCEPGGVSPKEDCKNNQRIRAPVL